jgi:hypothetical protein
MGLVGGALVMTSGELTDARADHPNGIISMAELRNLRPGSTNPFDSPEESPLSSSSSSDEELYTDALTLQTPISPIKAAAARKPPPPPPPTRKKPSE